MVTVTVYSVYIEKRLKCMDLYSRNMGGENQKRQAGGRFKTTVTHEDVLSTFEAVEGPVVTSSDVAAVCDCSGKTAKRKLEELADEGRINGRETAGRTVWWRTGHEEKEQ
jgi:response regulator of citrate/malate metabolism